MLQGSHQTQEAVFKNRVAHLGKNPTATTKTKISNSMKNWFRENEHPMLGRHPPRSTRLKMSKAQKKVQTGKSLPKPTKEQVRKWRISHSKSLNQTMEVLSGKFVCINFTKVTPDGVAIDFKNGKIYAVEVGTHSIVELESKYDNFDGTFWRNRKGLFLIKDGIQETINKFNDYGVK